MFKKDFKIPAVVGVKKRKEAPNTEEEEKNRGEKSKKRAGSKKKPFMVHGG